MLTPESCFRVIAREPITGGHSETAKEKLRVIVAEAGIDRERTVLLKRTTRREIDALIAAGAVPGTAAIPRLIRSGRDANGDWIAIPFYPGRPLPTETAPVPGIVMDSLAAIHAHYLGAAPPETIPARSPDWWAANCAQPQLRRLARPALEPMIDAVQGWSAHPLIVETLAERPRTLLHGDVHRNNVVVDGRASHLVDWGGAAYGMPLLDLITPGPPGSRAYRRYATAWQALTGQPATSLTWRRELLVATVCVKASYLAFVARNFGDGAAIARFAEAARALTELEREFGP